MFFVNWAAVLGTIGYSTLILSGVALLSSITSKFNKEK